MVGPVTMTRWPTGASPMRRIAATRISVGIARDLSAGGPEGAIAGVHRSALNIRWRRGLLTIAHESIGGLPNGVLVGSWPPLDSLGLAAHMHVASDGANLVVPEASLAVAFAGAALWSPAMPVVRGLARPAVERRVASAYDVAAREAPDIGFGPLLAALSGGPPAAASTVTAPAAGARLRERAAGCLLAIASGLRDVDVGLAIAAALPLVGLGPGATPSGDDLLVGLAAGLAATGHPLARRFADGIGRAAPGRTTLLSCAFLLHAARLEFSERVQRAALGILGPDAEGMGEAVRATLAWGASSGADLLLGLLVGMAPALPGISERLGQIRTSERTAA